jgi:hypothetical protein
VTAALAVVSAGDSAAQSYSVKECDSPPPALGILHGVGQVSYLIDAKGHPDTASIRVVSTDSISFGGMRSAAARELATCTFGVPSHAGKGSQSVFQQISFGGKKVFMSVAMATAALESDFTPPKPKLPTEPLEVLDPRLEERPRQLACDRAPNYPPIFGTPTSVQAANAARADWELRYSGRVVFRFVIGVDGRPEDGSIVVVSSTNPALTNIQRAVIPSCRYAPGRIGGLPVRTFMTVDRGGIVGGNPGR